MKDFLWVRERIQSVRDEALSPQALAAYEGEKTELMSLETKLIDGSEFAVRALEFKRIEFGNKPLRVLRRPLCPLIQVRNRFFTRTLIGKQYVYRLSGTGLYIIYMYGQ